MAEVWRILTRGMAVGIPFAEETLRRRGSQRDGGTLGDEGTVEVRHGQRQEYAPASYLEAPRRGGQDVVAHSPEVELAQSSQCPVEVCHWG